jgi:hypothetical protein
VVLGKAVKGFVKGCGSLSACDAAEMASRRARTPAPSVNHLSCWRSTPWEHRKRTTREVTEARPSTPSSRKAIDAAGS